MPIFYLVRHGEPDWALKDERKLKAALRDFVPLTELGILQAEQLAKASDFSHCELILSSPYTRSLQTAAILNRTLGLPLKVEFDLHEWTPDNWSADTVEELSLLWQDYNRHNGEYPTGEQRLLETKTSVTTRVQNVLRKYSSRSGVIVVCHGMIISTLMDLGEEPIDYCAVYEYILKQDYKSLTQD